MRNIGNVDLIPKIALILCVFWINNGREIISHVRNRICWSCSMDTSARAVCEGQDGVVTVWKGYPES